MCVLKAFEKCQVLTSIGQSARKSLHGICAQNTDRKLQDVVPVLRVMRRAEEGLIQNERTYT